MLWKCADTKGTGSLVNGIMIQRGLLPNIRCQLESVFEKSDTEARLGLLSKTYLSKTYFSFSPERLSRQVYKSFILAFIESRS